MVLPDGRPAAVPALDTARWQIWANISPDGRWVVYQSNESGADEIYVRPFAPPGAPRCAERRNRRPMAGVDGRWRRSGLAARRQGDLFPGSGGAMMAAGFSVQGETPVISPAVKLFQANAHRGRRVGVDAAWADSTTWLLMAASSSMSSEYRNGCRPSRCSRTGIQPARIEVCESTRIARAATHASTRCTPAAFSACAAAASVLPVVITSSSSATCFGQGLPPVNTEGAQHVHASLRGRQLALCLRVAQAEPAGVTPAAPSRVAKGAAQSPRTG